MAGGANLKETYKFGGKNHQNQEQKGLAYPRGNRVWRAGGANVKETAKGQLISECLDFFLIFQKISAIKVIGKKSSKNYARH